MSKCTTEVHIGTFFIRNIFGEVIFSIAGIIELPNSNTILYKLQSMAATIITYFYFHFPSEYLKSQWLFLLFHKKMQQEN